VIYHSLSFFELVCWETTGIIAAFELHLSELRKTNVLWVLLLGSVKV